MNRTEHENHETPTSVSSFQPPDFKTKKTHQRPQHMLTPFWPVPGIFPRLVQDGGTWKKNAIFCRSKKMQKKQSQHQQRIKKSEPNTFLRLQHVLTTPESGSFQASQLHTTSQKSENGIDRPNPLKCPEKNDSSASWTLEQSHPIGRGTCPCGCEWSGNDNHHLQARRDGSAHTPSQVLHTRENCNTVLEIRCVLYAFVTCCYNFEHFRDMKQNGS